MLARYNVLPPAEYFVAVCCSVLQCVAMCFSVLRVCCSILWYVGQIARAAPFENVCYSVLQFVAVCCDVLQCVVA